MKKTISIIIVTFNSQLFIERCLKSIKSQVGDLCIEVILIDNASQDKTVDAARKIYPEGIFLQNDVNMGFARANNQALKISSGEYILFLNPDIVLRPQTLEKCIKAFNANLLVGASGVKLLDSQNKPQNSYARFPSLKNLLFTHLLSERWRYDNLISRKESSPRFAELPFEIDWILGAFLFTTRKLMDQINGWDEDYFLYGEDMDLCYRFKKRGYRILYYPGISVLHDGPSPWTYSKYKAVYQALLLFYLNHYSRANYELLRSLMTLIFSLRFLKSDFNISLNNNETRVTNYQFYRELLQIIWRGKSLANRGI